MLESSCSVLHLSPQATPGEIRQAYARLVRRYPPEHFPEKFAAVHAAYRCLSLDEDFVNEIFTTVRSMKSPLELAGLLWGDLPTLQTDRKTDFSSLAPLLEEEPEAEEMDRILEQIDITHIEWSKP
ncbi:MAG: J domain-containing protein [Desulfovibrio sp.]|jgi:hypothetical protein|nr:J domain-containing protein [Desulfovibrio sp.]